MSRKTYDSLFFDIRTIDSRPHNISFLFLCFYSFLYIQKEGSILDPVMIIQFFYEIIASQAIMDKKETERLEEDFRKLHGYSSFNTERRQISK